MTDFSGPPEAGSDKDLFLSFVARALRAEAGVREQQASKKPTGYYAGRRAGFICAAATVATMRFGADYEGAKHVVSKGIAEASRTTNPVEMRRAAFAEVLGNSLFELALSVVV